MSADRDGSSGPPDSAFSSRAQRLSAGRQALLGRLRGGAAARGPEHPEHEPDAHPHEPFPLTEVQQAYWIGRDPELPLGGVAAFGYAEFDVPDLDVAHLEAAWNRLIHRHPALRAVISPQGTQHILPDVPTYRIAVEDLRDVSPAERSARLATVRGELSHLVPRTDAWPLFVVRATRVGRAVVRVHVGFDTLIADARSFDILATELDALLVDPDAPLAPIGLTFREYVNRTTGDAVRGQRERARSYWFDRLARLPAGPDLPRSTATASGPPRFVRYETSLDASAWEALSAQARDRRVTPSAALLGAYAVTLARWTSAPVFTLNLTLFNRRPLHPDVDNVVGCFTELCLLEVDLARPETFEDRARRIQAQLWSDLEHREVGAMEVMREIARRTGVQPMMPVVFTSALGTGGGGRSRLGRPVYAISQTPQVSIDYQVVESQGGVALWWDVAEDQFPPGMVRSMFDAHVELVRGLARSGDAWVARQPVALPAGMAADRDRLESAARPAGPRLLHEIVDLSDSHAVGVAGPREKTTRGELDALADRVAAALQQVGVRPNELVGVTTGRGANQVAAVLGVLRAGAAYVPLSPELPEARRTALAQRARIDVFVTDAAAASCALPPGVRRVRMDRELPDIAPRPADTLPGDLAYVLFTSGTTGTSKGVMISHEAAVNTVLDVRDRFAMTSDDAVLGLSELAFDLSVFDIFGTLAAGATLVVPADGVAAKDPAHWAELVERHRVTVWNSVPALMGMFVDHLEGTGAPPVGLRVALLSGDWIPVDLPERVRRVAPGVAVYSGGGATEAAIWSVLHPIDHVEPGWTSVPYGAPLTNQTARVHDALGDEVPDWVPGELHIGGAGVALGYWGDPARTADQFVPDPTRPGCRRYRTGDNARHLPGGLLEFLGRTDSQVKVNGYRVDLSEIEKELSAHPSVTHACALASGEAGGARRLRAFVVTREPHLLPEVLERLERRLPAYMVPAAIEAVDELPLTANDKVDRARLASRPWPRRADPAASPTSPRTRPRPVATLVADLVAEELALSSAPGPEDDLLQLGADSLAMVRLARKLRGRFGFAPSLVQVFSDPTIEGIASVLEALLVERVRPGGAAEVPHAPATEARVAPSRPAEGRRVSLPRPEGAERETEVVRVGSQSAEPGGGDPLVDHWNTLRTRRFPKPDAVPLAALGALLHPLREIATPVGARRLYPSAGGTYPVRVYVSVSPGRVDTLPPGVYLHDAATHALAEVGDAPVNPGEFDALVNRPIAERSAFVLLLVAHLPAIAPVYGNDATRFATLEAGAIAQLLREAAAESDLSLCMIGDPASPGIRAAARLGDGDGVVAMLAGGTRDDAEPAGAGPDTGGAMETGEL